MKTFITHSDIETQKKAEKMANNFKSGIIALTGPLGAGKTTFVQGFARGLGIKDKIISPTFVLIRQHKIPNTDKMLYHIDLYRLENKNHFEDLGLKDLLNDSNHLMIIEWAEKIKHLIPRNATWIKLEMLSENNRKITLF